MLRERELYANYLEYELAKKKAAIKIKKPKKKKSSTTVNMEEAETKTTS